MARPKAVAKSQTTLNAFVKTTKKKVVEEDVESDPEPVKDIEESEPEDEGERRVEEQTAKVNKKASPANSSLPPIHSIPEIFKDLVSHIPDVKSVSERVNGRKLRVATMCSGTESPLLALELIQESIEQNFGTRLEVEHVFSCEIEPFKQAYIERNFHPPILFRDICELGEDEATTAYGSLVPVPGDVDLLVAGTSCVDYSSLNNEKQDIDANGESGRTFRGMMSWVDKHRPPLVILENVCSAPWDRVSRYFEKNGYSASFLRVDTKNYYIPHTRTRVYLLAVHQRKSSLPDAWKSLVIKLQRPASTTLDQWLLPTDDQRIHQARQKLVQESSGVDRRAGRTDWGRCESRHQRARLEEALGNKRPLTSWDDGGYCKLPDFAWNDWGVAQVERVWDLMDITLLRSAKLGIDPSYKTLVWNLSQNVDREIGSKRLGVAPCLTPTMIPYITNRGGPMVGIEALSMQGLPVDKLLLTRETEDQLADLAGNAMSTTVVGACMLAALVIGKKLLKEGDDRDTYEEKARNADAYVDDDVRMKTEQSHTSVEDRISGEDQLFERPLDLSTTKMSSLPQLLSRASSSARLCECEGRSDMTSRVLNRCRDCDSSSCEKCGGRPEHNYFPIDFTKSSRLHPSSFAQELKSALPMCITVSGISEDLLDDLHDEDIPAKKWKAWKAAVLRAANVEQRFVELKRQEIWVASYESPVGSLELQLHPKQPEWRFFAKAEKSEPANSEIRKVLDFPVGRLRCEGGLLSGRWEFALPQSSTVKVFVKGVGEIVEAWQARLGLLDEYKDRKVFSKIEFTVPRESRGLFDRDISGVYTLLEKCGTATNALHRKDIGHDTSLPTLFLFLDPTRCGTSDEDPFVFSISKRRYQFGEVRPIICKLDPKWRQAAVTSHEKAVDCHLPCAWVASSLVELKPSKGREARFAIPGDTLSVSVSNDHCVSANALLVCKVPLKETAGPEWPRDKWVEVDKIHERVTFQALAWLVERIKSINDKFDQWMDVQAPHSFETCRRCAPQVPAIRWMKVDKKIRAIEDSAQAGAYERALKNRPSPFVTQLKLDGRSGVGIVRIGVNISSLIHRAYSRLPSADRSEQPRFSWRLNTDFTDPAKLNLPKFKLKSNRQDAEHKQPQHFKIPLRPEQLRSLGWMLQQESLESPPFVEEEIAEAVLDHLGWRAQGRAQRPVRVRGGVLADEVGYGKTAITLGLIDSASKSVKEEARPPKSVLHGKIYVRGTLIVVPPHLTRQWGSEIKKFTGSHFDVVIISTASSLNTLTIEQVKDADIVVVASNLFHSSVYLANLEAVAAGGALPQQDGRYFNARLDLILSSLRDQVERLRREGPSAVMEEIHEARKRDEEATDFVLKKRLKGAKAREAAEANDPARSSKDDDEMDVDEVSHSSSTLVMEVVIPSREFSLSAYSPFVEEPETSEAPTSVPSSDVDSPVEALPSAQRRYRTGFKSIVISDDEDKGEGSLPKLKSAKSKTNGLKLKKRVSKKEDSDFECSSSSDEDDSAVQSYESDDSIVKRETAKKTSGSAKPSKKSAGPSNKGVPDNSAKKAGKNQKRKIDAVGNDKPAKKAKLREETDPWKLKTKAVKDDWRRMHSPPLEMFYFERLVIDEYTYLDGKILSMVQKLTATRRWVLSGTPPIHDFASLKTIAAFLDIHLGVDDDGEGQSALVKKRRREQTDVEKFHSFREVHSLEWHAHRHEIGQGFLDQFVRQNIAEIDEIPWTEKVELIDLPAAERAIYLELEHHLRALDMTIKRSKKTESDREKRMAQALGESSSAEEALLKRCSHFDLDITEEENAMKACEVIVRERNKQLQDCGKELVQKLVKALEMQKKIGKSEETFFLEFVRVTRNEGLGDADATKLALKLFKEAGIEAPLAPVTSKPYDQSKNKAGVSGKGKDALDLMWELREHTHDLRRLVKELTGRVRSLRYFTVVRDLQRQVNDPPRLPCVGCGREKVPVTEIAVLSSCGHTGCYSCVIRSAEREECVLAGTGTGACKAQARVLNVVKGSTLGVDDIARDGNGRHYGLKLERVVDLIKNRIPKTERALIFVQFPDLMKKVGEALTAHKIAFLEIKGSASQKSKNLERFQEGGPERVLLLNVTDESASGANLTGANHAIFLSPLLTATKEIYDACETQAIGRVRRYGQTRTVHVWRFLSTGTIDIEIYEQRTGKKLR